MALIAMLAAPFLMRSMLSSSSLRAVGTDRSGAYTTLAFAHAFVVLTLLLGVAAHTAHSLTAEQKPDPLALYPGGRRGLAAYHLWGDVAATGLWLLFFFYLFYGALIIDVVDRPLLVLPFHFAVQALVLAACGAMVYRSTLRGVERRPDLGRPGHVVASVGAILAFLAMVGSPTLVGDLPPQTLADVARRVDLLATLYPPLALLGRPGIGALAPLAWLGWIAAITLAFRVAIPLMRAPSPLLLGDVESTPVSTFTSPLTRPLRPSFGGPAGVRLFFLKDIWLPATRHRGRFLKRQWALAAIAVTGPIVMWQLRREGRMDDIVAEAVLWGVVMVLPSLAAYLTGLSILGREGSELALIRPILRPVALWGHKVLPALGTVATYGVLYGAITGASAAVLNLEPGPAEGAALGGLTGVVAAVNAVALGFLFPDFRRGSVLTPGASRTGRRLFEALVLYGVGIVLATFVMARKGVIPSGLLGPTLLATAGMGLGLGGILTVLSLRRLPGLEI